MQRNRIVNAGANAGFFEMVHQAFAIGSADNIEVIDRSRARRLVGCEHGGVCGFKQLLILRRTFAALGVPLWQMSQLHVQETGLNCVQASVVTFRSEERRVGKGGRSRWSPY